MPANSVQDPRREMWVCGDESGTLNPSRGLEDRYFLIVTVGMEGESLRQDFDGLAAQLRPIVGDATEGLFHASYDTPLTRDHVFALLGSRDLIIDASIVDKDAVPLELTGRLGYRLYTLLWYHHLIHVLPGLLNPTNKVHLVVAALGEYSRKQAFRDALAQATGAAYMPLYEKALVAVGYSLAGDDIHHRLPALRFSIGDARQDRLLQVADYCAWAIRRKLTRNDDRGYNEIRHLIRSERVLTIGKKATVHNPAAAVPLGLVSMTGLTGLTHEYAVSTEYRVGPADSFQALLALQEAIQSGDTKRAIIYLEAIRPSDMWHDKDRFQGFLSFVGLLVDEVIADPSMALRATSTLAETARYALATHGHDLLPRAFLSAALYNQGLVLGRLGQDDDALRAYDEVITQPNDDRVSIIDAQIAKALVNKANIIRRRGEEVTAFDLYCRAVECSSGAGADMPLFDEPLANAVAALVNLATIDERRTEATYQRVIASGDLRAKASATNSLGLLLRDRRDLAGAEAAFGQAIAANHPDISPRAANTLGWLLRSQRRIAEAEGAYQRALDSGHVLEAPKAALNLGCLCLERGEHDTAEALLRHALAHSATAPEAEFHLAQVFAQTGRFAEVESAARRAIATSNQPIAGRAHTLLGWLLHKRGDRTAAEGAYQDAIATGDPEVAAQATHFLGVLYYERGEFIAAEAAFERAIHSGQPKVALEARQALDEIRSERGDDIR